MGHRVRATIAAGAGSLRALDPRAGGAQALTELAYRSRGDGGAPVPPRVTHRRGEGAGAEDHRGASRAPLLDPGGLRPAARGGAVRARGAVLRPVRGEAAGVTAYRSRWESVPRAASKVI